MQRMLKLVGVMMILTLVLVACGQGGTTTTQPEPAAPGDTQEAPAADAPAADAPAADAPAEEAPVDEAPAESVTEEEEEAVELGSGDTTVTIWHGWQGEYYNAIEAIFAEYAQENNISIELLRVPDLNNKVQVAIPSGQGPDIIAWVNDQIGKNALSGLIVPVDEFGIDEAYLRENFTEVAADAMIYEGQVYGVPESMEALTFIFNRDLISEDELPATTDELIARAQEFNGDGRYLFVYNARNDAYFSAPWWQGSGVTLVTPEGETELGSAQGVAAAELIRSFTEIMPTEIDYGVADTLFKEGNAAIIMNGPWSIADYEAAGLNVGLATIPIVSNSGEPGRPFVGVKMLMLAANSRAPEAAAALMQHYGSAEVQARLAEVNKQVPANAAAQEQVASDPIIAGFINQAANGVPMPNSEFIDAMWDPIGKTVEAVWTGASSPEEAVQDGAALFEEKAQDLR